MMTEKDQKESATSRYRHQPIACIFQTLCVLCDLCGLKHYLLKSVSIIALALGMAMSARADIVSNCFKVVSYGVNWHVECTLDGYSDAVDIAIDDKEHITNRCAELIGMGVAPSIVNPETGCETNCFDTVSGKPSHIVYRRNHAIDFSIDEYTESCWRITVRHASGHGYIKQVPSGTYVNDSLFSECRTVDGYDSGNLFFIAFKWMPDANDDTSPVRYGWLAIGFLNGAPSVLASEMSDTEGAPLVGRGFRGANDGSDEPVEGLIWRCNFNNGVEWMDITDLVEVASHVLLIGGSIEATIDDGSYSGRRCAAIGGASGERAWFFVNAKSNDGVGTRYVPGKWQSLKTSFRLKSNVSCWPSEKLYGTIPEPGSGLNSELRRIIRIPGSVVNLDDKIALRYCDYELDDDHHASYWQINAGVTNGLGGIEARTIRLAAKGQMSELVSPVGNWITVEIEAVNDGSPLGLAYRIYINGVLACSEEDGASVFRARPEAADRTGVSALGIGGNAFVDDIVFSGVATDPLAGINISPMRFESAQIELTNDELVNLVGIVGFETISGLERIFLEPWGSGDEPEDAPKTCMELGISPFLVEADGQNGLMLYFKSPTVVATGIDPVARTVTGRIVPAEGTRVAQPPMTYMFGINRHMDFGTLYSHVEEYGYEMNRRDNAFQLDTSNYATSNGVFTITYDPKFSDEDSAFFSLSIKDFRN